MKEFPILYKYTQKKQVQQWQIFVEGNEYWTEEGIQGGVITKSLPTICKGKNIGKKNESTASDQALKEAAAKHKEKGQNHYNEVLQEERSFLEPMLAEKYEDYPINWTIFDLAGIRVFGQPKLDGLRSVSKDKKLYSRNGKEYVGSPHLCQSLTTLDGELYSHRYHDDFNAIVSLCKKKNPTAEQLKESAEKVEFWAYDLPESEGNGTYSQRYELLKEYVKALNNPMIKVVECRELFSDEDLIAYHDENIAKGYEGTMIRIDNAPYENKRSKQLLKFKDFIDEEFKIVGYKEGEGGRAGTIGHFIMQHDKDPNQTFHSNVKGDHKYLRELWDNRNDYIGKTATVKYFQRTPKTDKGGDVPRFPYIIKINREEYE